MSPRTPLQTCALALLAAACARPPAEPGGPAPAAPAPRAACLAEAPLPSPGELTGAAEDALERGEPGRALGCADEAIALAPRDVLALAARARALAALERLDDARHAWGRALAVDPDDPEVLLGAADLHVRRLGPAREALETGLEHALRGVRAARARAGRDLAARLELVAGMAENDLGRSHLALPHLERAAAVLAADPDVSYERGVALFELCRFAEAQRAFERTLALAPDDPWTLHQLGLLAERRGAPRKAEALLAQARRLAPRDFRPELGVGPDAFRAEVAAAIAALPEPERRALDAVPVEIQDLPDATDLLAVDPPLSPSILGLFRGPAEDEPCLPSDGPRCRAIVLYRKNLLRFARDARELSEQVRVTLLHELGHLHGENDDDLRARGLE